MRYRICIGLLWVCVAQAQSKGPRFEVTSVKAGSQARLDRILPNCSNGRFLARAPVYFVIGWAYDLKTDQLNGLRAKLPQWAQQAGSSFEIQAVGTGSVTDAQCRQMVQSLLADRFKFAAHWEAGTAQVYDLVVMRGGAKLQKIDESDQTQGIFITMNGRAQPIAALKGPTRGLTMEQFADFLSPRITRALPVFDKTGLDGIYKIKLAFSFQQQGGKQVDASDPPIEVAIQSQLGLKLDERTAAVDVLVTDHIEMPDSN